MWSTWIMPSTQEPIAPQLRVAQQFRGLGVGVSIHAHKPWMQNAIDIEAENVIIVIIRLYNYIIILHRQAERFVHKYFI